jgi:hypothetical protein
MMNVCRLSFAPAEAYVRIGRIIYQNPKMRAEFFGRNVEDFGSEGLVDRDVDAAEPGAVHAGESLQTGAGVDDRDIHG